MGKIGAANDRRVLGGRAEAATSSVEVVALGGRPQRGLVRPSRTNIQRAETSEIVRALHPCSTQGLQTLNEAPPHPLSEVRLTAEIPTPNRSQAVIGSALPLTLPLTLRQLEVLRCVEQYVDARGYPPSLSELCTMLGTSSKDGVVGHLKGLEKKGYLRRDAGERRGLQALIPSSQARVVEPAPLRKAHLCDRCKREVG